MPTFERRPRRLLAYVSIAALTTGTFAISTVASAADTATDATTPVARMTAGPESVTDSTGAVWSARSDTLGTSNLSTALVGKDIRGTTEDALYQRNAWGVKGYSTPVPTAGTYRVRLLFAEDYWWASGKRVFDVAAEGSVVAKDIDIFRAVGKGAAYDVTFDVPVEDGTLDLSFLRKVDNPAVSAIEVTPVKALSADAPFDARVTPRTSAFTYGGHTWAPSYGWSGPVATSTDLEGKPIGGTVDEPLYTTQISGMTGWRTPVPEDGVYTVQVFMAESSYNQVGQRVFDVTAEGATALADVDPYKAAGVRTAYAPTFDVQVSDGVLDLGFVAKAGAASISAIRVTRRGDTTPVVDPTTAPDTRTSGFVPDPSPVPSDAEKSVFVSRMSTKTAAFTDSQGRRWAPLSSGMGSWQRSTALEGKAVAGTTAPEPYRTNVWGSSAYALPVSADPATYKVRLLMAEDYFTAPGKRVFDVLAEGQTVASAVDIFAAAGARRAHDVAFDTTVTDGMLNLDFVKRADQPLISAIEVVSTEPVTPVSSAPRRILPVSPQSFWTQDVSQAPVDPNTAAITAAVKYDVDTRYGGIAGFNAYNYSVGFHTADAGDEYATVDRTCAGSTWTPGVYDGAAHFLDVPVPDDAVSAAGTDANLSIYDPRTDKYWAFWQMRKNPDTGRWSACWGGRIDDMSKDQGIFPTGFGASASGLPLGPGMVTQDEARRGKIDHAVAIVVPNARKDLYSWPANRTDGVSPSDDAIRQGQRMRLDPTLDLDEYALTPLGRAVAEAGQKYGFIPVDTSGAVAVLAEGGDREAAATGTNPWNGIIGDRHWEVMRNFPWDKMQALPVDYGRP